MCVSRACRIDFVSMSVVIWHKKSKDEHALTICRWQNAEY